MNIFKSSLFIIVKHVIYSIFGGVVITFLLNIFLHPLLSIVIGVALGLLFMYFAIIGDNFKVVVEDDRFTVYKRNKMKHQFYMDEVSLHAKIKTVNGDSDCTLTVTTADGEDIPIDLTMLGQSRFYKLLNALNVFDSEPIEVKTITKK